MISIQNLHLVPFLHETEQLRQMGTLCDTVLRVDGLSFKAHALILALASNRLKRQLTDQPNEGGGFSCAIESVSSHTFKQILDYVYGKIIQVPKKDMQELLRGAEYLEMETLVEQCQSLLREPGKDDSHQIENAERKKIQKDTQRSTTSQDGFSVEGSLTSINPGPSQSLSSPVTQKKISSPYSPIFISSSSFSTSPHFYCPAACPSQSMLLNYRQLTPPPFFQGYLHSTPMYTIIQSPVSSSLMGYSSLYHPSYPFTPSPSIQNSPYIEGKNLSIHAAFTGSIPENHKRKPETLDKKERCCRRCAQWPMGNPCRSANGSSNSGSVDMAVSGRFYGQGRDRRSLRSIRRGLCGDKPYQCEQCSKRFSLKHQLDTHRRVHTGEKPFECRICGQRSRDYSAMIKHLRTHSGATPYQCTVCREFCSSLNAMQKHLKTHPSQDFPPDWSLRNTYLYISHTERC